VLTIFRQELSESGRAIKHFDGLAAFAGFRAYDGRQAPTSGNRFCRRCTSDITSGQVQAGHTGRDTIWTRCLDPLHGTNGKVA